MTTIRSTETGPIHPGCARSIPYPAPESLAGRMRWIGITGIVAAVVLSIAGVLLVLSPENNGSAAAAIGVVFMTAPVVLARRWPILAVGIVAAARPSSMVCCGTTSCAAARPFRRCSTSASPSVPASRLGHAGQPGLQLVPAAARLGHCSGFRCGAGRLGSRRWHNDFYPFGVGLVAARLGRRARLGGARRPAASARGPERSLMVTAGPGRIAGVPAERCLPLGPATDNDHRRRAGATDMSDSRVLQARGTGVPRDGAGRLIARHRHRLFLAAAVVLGVLGVTAGRRSEQRRGPGCRPDPGHHPAGAAGQDRSRPGRLVPCRSACCSTRSWSGRWSAAGWCCRCCSSIVYQLGSSATTARRIQQVARVWSAAPRSP